jgi:DNA-binding transcriptional ArsR family regulator
MIEQAQTGSGLAVAEAELFKALAHPARAQVLGVLAVGPATVPDLCAATGLKPSHLAGHLTQLRAHRLIAGKRSGGRLLYGLSFPEVASMLSAAESVLSARALVESDGLPGIGAPEMAVQHAGRADVRDVVEELVPVLEQSLETRALIAGAVELLKARTGRSAEAALAVLLAEAREGGRPLAQVAKDATAGDKAG